MSGWKIKTLSWAICAALWVLSANVRDPLSFEFRGMAILVLGLSLAVLSTFAGWQVYRRKSLGNGAFLAACLAANVTLAVTEVSWHHARTTVLDASPHEIGPLGQHLVAGYTNIGELLPLVEKGAIGGIFITRRNVADSSAETIRREIATLQSARQANGLCPLIVTTDQEGGSISRLSPPLTRLPALAQWLATPGPEHTARGYGEIHGRELASLGINVNLAPVADLMPDAPPGALDFHSRISQRAISSDPGKVALATREYVEGLGKHGVKGTLKHFPGLAKVDSDTHHFSATLDASPMQLDGKDWLPFRQTLAATDALLMLAHVRLGAIDRDVPVSFSQPVVEGIIRKTWRHEGVLITDDLTMGAAYRSRQGIGNAAVMALNASVDLLLVSYDADQVYEVIAALLTAKRQGKLDSSRLDASASRLERLFRWKCPAS